MKGFRVFTKFVELLTAPQNISATWTSIGSLIAVKKRGYRQISLALTYTKELSSGIKIRPVGVDGSDTFDLPIKSAAGSGVTVSKLLYLLPADTANTIVFAIDIDPSMDIQLQILADTPGGTPAEFTSIKYALSY